MAEINILISDLLKSFEEYQLDLDLSPFQRVNYISSIFNQVTKERTVSYLSDDSEISTFLSSSNYSTFPDKVIFCGAKFLTDIRFNTASLISFIKKNGYTPKVVITDNSIYLVGKSLSHCRDIEAVLKAHVMCYSFNKINKLTQKEEQNLINMDAEKYRAKCI